MSIWASGIMRAIPRARGGRRAHDLGDRAMSFFTALRRGREPYGAGMAAPAGRAAAFAGIGATVNAQARASNAASGTARFSVRGARQFTEV